MQFAPQRPQGCQKIPICVLLEQQEITGRWIDSESGFSLDGASADGARQGLGPVLTPIAINATNENEPYSFHNGGC